MLNTFFNHLKLIFLGILNFYFLDYYVSVRGGGILFYVYTNYIDSNCKYGVRLGMSLYIKMKGTKIQSMFLRNTNYVSLENCNSYVYVLKDGKSW
jgi:hypothetical protein